MTSGYNIRAYSDTRLKQNASRDSRDMHAESPIKADVPVCVGNPWDRHQLLAKRVLGQASCSII